MLFVIHRDLPPETLCLLGSGDGYDFYAAGSGTNYGPFTGAHEVRLSVSFPTAAQAGLIVSVTGEAHIRQSADGGVGISSTLPTVRLADTPRSPVGISSSLSARWDRISKKGRWKPGWTGHRSILSRLLRKQPGSRRPYSNPGT